MTEASDFDSIKKHMKSLLRNFLVCLTTLYLTTLFNKGFQIEGDLQTFLTASAVFTVIAVFLKPVLKLLFFPINLLSLGLFSWLINVAVLYLLTFFVPQVKVLAWDFSGFSYQQFNLPAYHFTVITNFIFISFILSFMVNFLNWLSH